MASSIVALPFVAPGSVIQNPGFMPGFFVYGFEPQMLGHRRQFRPTALSKGTFKRLCFWKGEGAGCGMKAFLPITAILSAGAACAAEDISASPGRGHDFVKNNCAACHSVEKEGSSPNPKSPPFRDLHLKYPIDNLREALAEGIVTGHNAMPEFALKGEQINDVVAYIKSLGDK